MIYLKQFYLGCLAHASYLVADTDSKVAAVIDPQRDIDQYLEEAEGQGFQIKHVLLTHFHADFVSGHLELRDRVGAAIHLGARAQAEYDFTPLKDGQSLELGKLRLRAIETPGHTPEAICILAYDLDKDQQSPLAVFTGDTLFIGDVGRPDLFASAGLSADELASMLYDSLHEKLLPLPDETLVYPAHGAGSMCGKNLSKERVSTLGMQRRVNYALQPMSKEEFVRLVSSDLPEAPQYFAHSATLNRLERPTLRETLDKVLKPLPLEEVLNLQAGGAQVLDVRDPSEYAGAHLKDSINIGLKGTFATWAGTILNREHPIVIVADPEQEYEAAMRLGRIGFDHIAGYLENGMESLKTNAGLVRQTQRITATELSEVLQADKNLPVLDVRTEQEWQDRHIEGSINIPLNQLIRRIDEVPRVVKLPVHCLGGYRSSIAVSILEARGIHDSMDLVGGISAWEAAKLETVRPATTNAACQAE